MDIHAAGGAGADLHREVPPEVLQVLGPTKAAPAVLMGKLKVTRVPSGAGPKPLTPSPPAARPSSCWTVAVTICSSLTSLVSTSGLRSIWASTQRLVAGSLLPAVPLVVRVRTEPSARVTSAVA